jgi:short-subunit dehydrogenase involved in D-alanine esterification of teichoic acids
VDQVNCFSWTLTSILLKPWNAGIGLMMAKSLAENGASKVYIVGRREDVLQEAAKSYPG